MADSTEFQENHFEALSDSISHLGMEAKSHLLQQLLSFFTETDNRNFSEEEDVDYEEMSREPKNSWINLVSLEELEIFH